MNRAPYKFFNPDYAHWAEVAAEIDAQMSLASVNAEVAALTALAGSTFASFVSAHTASPGTTGANEESSGGTVTVTVGGTTTTATNVAAGVGTFQTGSSHGLSVGNSVSFLGLTGTGWTTLNTVAGGQGAYVVTSVPDATHFTIAMPALGGGYATNPTGSPTVQIGYSRVGIAWSAAAGPSPASMSNSATLVMNIPASTITNFGTWAQLTGSGGNGYIFGGTLSSITFPSPGTVTVAAGGLVEQMS